MKKIEGFEYYIDKNGITYKETKEGFKIVKQDFYSYKFYKDGKAYKYNKCELLTKTYLGELPKGYGILVKDGDTKNTTLDNFKYVKYSDLGVFIKNFEDYLITKDGIVYSTKNNKILKMATYTNRNGYEHIKLCKDNKTYIHLIHRLVAVAYIPNPENKEEVDHIDGVKLNNKSNNLRWSTRKENVGYALEKNTPVRNYKECILYKGEEFIKSFKSIAECCRYAEQNFKCSYSSLMKYKKYGEYRIEKP